MEGLEKETGDEVTLGDERKSRKWHGLLKQHGNLPMDRERNSGFREQPTARELDGTF
jgi:hypothetical protein